MQITCPNLNSTDFDEYKIPAPPADCENGDEDTLLINFTDSEEAVKYAIHLGDVHDRMGKDKQYTISRKKIKAIIAAVNDQADFGSITL